VDPPTSHKAANGRRQYIAAVTDLPQRLRDLLEAPSTCLLAATNPDGLSQKYTGRPFRNHCGTPQVRVLLTVRAARAVHTPRR